MNETEQTIVDFLTANKIEFTVSYKGEKKNTFGSVTTDEWAVSTKGKNGPLVEFCYFTGLGHRTMPKGKEYEITHLKLVHGRFAQRYIDALKKPKAPNIVSFLHGIVIDSEACSISFNDWAENYGYDSDSIKARDTYDQCQDSGDKLKKVFTQLQIAELSELLQDY